MSGMRNKDVKVTPTGSGHSEIPRLQISEVKAVCDFLEGAHV